MKKRFLSVFMVLCMMLTMVPSAFAEGADGDTLQNKINQAIRKCNNYLGQGVHGEYYHSRG